MSSRPTSPEQAHTLSRRWWFAAVVAAAVAVLLVLAGVPFAMEVGLLVLVVCLCRYARWEGWRDGFRAGEVAEMRRCISNRQQPGGYW